MAQSQTYSAKFKRNLGNGVFALSELSNAVNHALEKNNSNQVAECYNGAIAKKDTQAARMVRQITQAVWLESKFEETKKGSGNFKLTIKGLAVSNSATVKLNELVQAKETLRGQAVGKAFSNTVEKTAKQKAETATKNDVNASLKLKETRAQAIARFEAAYDARVAELAAK